jgi:hypothetical protein
MTAKPRFESKDKDKWWQIIRSLKETFTPYLAAGNWN